MRAAARPVRALIANQVNGVTDGLQPKQLEIVGVGYRAAVKGKMLDLQMQFSHPVEYPIPAGITIATPDRPTSSLGYGQAAGRPGRRGDPGYRKPEPYKGKGIRYTDEHHRGQGRQGGAASSRGQVGRAYRDEDDFSMTKAVRAG